MSRTLAKPKSIRLRFLCLFYLPNAITHRFSNLKEGKDGIETVYNKF